MSFNIIISILGVLSGMYALTYANWEFSNKNKLGTTVIYIFTITSIFLSVFQNFA